MPGVGLKRSVNAGLQMKTRLLPVYILNRDSWIQLICRLLFLLVATLTETSSVCKMKPLWCLGGKELTHLFLFPV